MPCKDKSAEEGIKMISGWEHTVSVRADNATPQQKTPTTLSCTQYTQYSQLLTWWE